tara:strand:- start:834 stop:1223 length:390 start_codon:yes stop_codon:yes gene_type:complete
MKDFDRGLRVADFIRDELSQIIMSDMRDPRVGIIGVNEVTVSKDLSFADIYVSCLNVSTDQEKLTLVEILNNASGFLRSELSNRHKMRTTPKLRFFYDDMLEKSSALEELIDTAIESDAERRTKTAESD